MRFADKQTRVNRVPVAKKVFCFIQHSKEFRDGDISAPLLLRIAV
jgi:hypothetical protein